MSNIELFDAVFDSIRENRADDRARRRARDIQIIESELAKQPKKEVESANGSRDLDWNDSPLLRCVKRGFNPWDEPMIWDQVEAFLRRHSLDIRSFVSYGGCTVYWQHLIDTISRIEYPVLDLDHDH